MSLGSNFTLLHAFLVYIPFYIKKSFYRTSMILIVESGSTKSDWVLLDRVNILNSFQKKGWNPVFLSSEQMMLRLKSYSELKSIFTKITEVHFYSPGCSSALSFDTLEFSLKSYFVNAKVIIKSDMYAAARAAYKGNSLFVSILGTGSNTAFYNEIVFIS